MHSKFFMVAISFLFQFQAATRIYVGRYMNQENFETPSTPEIQTKNQETKEPLSMSKNYASRYKYQKDQIDIKQGFYQPTTAFNQNTKSELIENENYKTDYQPIQGMNTLVVY